MAIGKCKGLPRMQIPENSRLSRRTALIRYCDCKY